MTIVLHIVSEEKSGFLKFYQYYVALRDELKLCNGQFVYSALKFRGEF